MRRILACALVLGFGLLAAPTASAHWVKLEGCGGTPWVDQNPADNDLLGPDPDAVLVLHLRCSWLHCVGNIDPVLACKPHS